MNLIEQDVIANGIRLHVYRTGTDQPPLVFAHGFTDNGPCYLPFAAQFAGDYELVLYDARGHGKSEATEAPTSILDRANDLAGLVDVLGLQKPVLVGHSMGAVTVALCAGQNPGMARGIVLEDPPPFGRYAQARPQPQAAPNPWLEIARANKQRSLEDLLAINRQENPAWPEAERQPWAQSKRQMSLSIFEGGIIDIAGAEQIVSQITCPALIVTSDPQKGGLFPAQDAEALAVSLPDARHVNIAGAGHNIRREQPQTFFATVDAFLKGLP